ncbi:MAG: 2-C-methyl-D-erythritol 2,4-cyclodiphosphate synthase [Candidatus Thioglobus sp.]|nr:2-C-methyl-D-erythritol 2,4-cyclodiphosphate synthase [Candidatus Thioglobus sp.]
MKIKTGLGQDSHAFETNKKSGSKPLILAGIVFENSPSLRANSDGDAVLHSLTNAISSITGNNILGGTADKLCQKGITDSGKYLALALQDLAGWRIENVAISIECLSPKIAPMLAEMKKKIAILLNIKNTDVGITATSGEGLTAFGRGEGIQVLSIITVSK